MPPHGWKEAVRVLERFGFRFERQKGDHKVYSKPGLPRPIIVPTYDNLPPFIIKNIYQTAGILKRDYVEALKRRR